MIRISFFLIIILNVCYFTANAQVINEVQASNGNTFADEDGDFEDWIELFNPTDSPIELEGFGLSDNLDEPFKWIFPEITLAPDEYLLIWASGKNRTIPSSELHTNFKISAAGEELILTNPSEILVDEIEPIAIPRDKSFGRQPDGSDQTGFFQTPTPGASNTTAFYEGVVNTPIFSQPGGTYTDSFILSIESEDGATIRLTTNGSAPTETSGQTYNGPFQVSNTGIIRVKAFKDNHIPSETASFQHVRLHTEIQDFNSDLPVVVMNQFLFGVDSSERVPVSLLFFEPDENGRTTLSGTPTVTSRANANLRGSSSLEFPKKMYGFHLFDETDGNRDEPLLGMPEEHNWILYAPYSDKSLMRNVVAYALASDFGRYAPRTRFIELFEHVGNGALTSANYHGVYVLVERIKWGEDRVNITKLEPTDNQEPEISGGYIIKKDRLDEDQFGFETDRGTNLAFARPQEEDATDAQKNWIRTYMNDFESALYGNDFTDPANGYQAFIDTDSFIDHFLITELLKEIDGYRLSTFMYKDRNGKLIMGPVWDFNLSLGNADYLQGWLTEGWYYPETSNDCFIGCGVRDWYVRLMEDPDYVEQMQQRWWMHRQTIFSNESLTAIINENREILLESQERNFQRWPILGEYVWPNWFIAQTWQEELDWMQQWLLDRAAWIDSQMGDEPDFPDFQLADFWYFSNDLPNDTPLLTINATYPDGSNAFIEFNSALQGYPFDSNHPHWRKASMERRNRPTDINYREEANNGESYDEDSMRALQVRQPFTGDAGENELIFHLPTHNYGSILFSFTAMDEGAANQLLIDYSVNANDPEWITTGLSQTAWPLSSSYQLYQVDFTTIDEASYNADFKIRIRFDGDDMSADNGNRVTFNNISLDAGEITTSTPGNTPEVPLSFELKQNYPNPFNPETTIQFTLSQSEFTELSVYNAIGQLVSTPVSANLPSGSHSIRFDASHLPSGVYIYTLKSGHQSQTRKFLLLK